MKSTVADNAGTYTFAGLTPGDYTVQAVLNRYETFHRADGTTLKITLKGPVNPNWYTYNELSQITPMPQAWAITKAGQKPQLCGTASYQEVTTQTHTTSKGTTVVPVSAAAKSCAAVYNFLAGEAKGIVRFLHPRRWRTAARIAVEILADRFGDGERGQEGDVLFRHALEGFARAAVTVLDGVDTGLDAAAHGFVVHRVCGDGSAEIVRSIDDGFQFFE